MFLQSSPLLDNYEEMKGTIMSESIRKWVMNHGAVIKHHDKDPMTTKSSEGGRGSDEPERRFERIRLF